MAGNHARFLFDFAPDSIVFRITDDPAPRLLYCFQTFDQGRTVEIPELERRVRAGDVDPKELVVGGALAAEENPCTEYLSREGAMLFDGVKSAVEAACGRIREKLSSSKG